MPEPIGVWGELGADVGPMLDSLGKGVRELGKYKGALRKTESRLDRFTRKLDVAAKAIKRTGEAMSRAGRMMAIAGGVVLGVVGGMIKKFASYGDQIGKMAKRTGFSTEALSRLGHAANLSGTDIGSLETSLRRMSRSVEMAKKGTGEAADALKELGIVVENLRGLSPEQQFLKFAEAIRQIEDPMQKAAMAQIVFGRAGTMLIPLFDEGAEGIRKMGEEAEALGIVLDTEAAAKAEKLTDDMLRVKTALMGTTMQIAQALLPAVTSLAKAITDWGKRAAKWVKQNKPLVMSIVKTVAAITAVGVALIALGAAAKGVAALIAVVKAVIVVVKALKLAMILLGGPTAIFIAAIVGATIIIIRNWDKVGAAADALWTRIKTVFGWIGRKVKSVFDGIMDVLHATFDPLKWAEIVARALVAAWDRIKTWVRKMLGKFKEFRDQVVDYMSFWKRLSPAPVAVFRKSLNLLEGQLADFMRVGIPSALQARVATPALTAAGAAASTVITDQRSATINVPSPVDEAALMERMQSFLRRDEYRDRGV